LDGFEGGERGGTGKRMAAESAAQAADSRRIHDFGAPGDRSDRHASAKGLGHGDEVGFDAEVFGGEPLPGAAATGLHFIGDEEDAVLTADLLEQREIVARRNDEAAFAEDRLSDDRGDGFGSDGAFECVLEMVREGLGRGAFSAAIGISKWDPVNVAGKWVEARFVGMRLAGKGPGQESPAVKGVLEADDGGTFRVSAGNLDGVLNGFGAGVEQDGLLWKFTGSERVELFRDGYIAFIRSDGEAEMEVLLELLLDRRRNAR